MNSNSNLNIKSPNKNATIEDINIVGIALPLNILYTVINNDILVISLLLYKNVNT